MRKHTAAEMAEMGKSGQIRDTKPQTGQMGVPGELCFFVPEVTLLWTTVSETGSNEMTCANIIF